MPSTILSNISNIDGMRENSKKSGIKSSTKQKKQKKNSQSKTVTSNEDKKKALKRYFRKKVYRPIIIRRILSSKVVKKRIIFTYNDDKGNIMQGIMEDLIENEQYANLVFEFLNRRRGSLTTHFECGLYDDMNG
ncbi:Hypothetical protein SRAE_2000326300 [Strongyloides ratti]|uniref:Uncharacterized protein n=1 Tax=Strongyloides ratti TaxID=34506 RepID=A0A090LFS1_STRRB|nr:Hypothetical protein SRAE_2000326300 [Strongyloides ratti]CEF68607.1 Hypothetical protein SRAE_2000326300 [Strongyloides ratti]